MKIHLISLISPEIEIDILPHWIKYYKAFNLDSYVVYLHCPVLRHTKKYDIAKQMLNDNGIKTFPAYGEFGDGKIKHNIFNAYKENLPPDDYLLTVDGDEFQQWETWDLHTLLNNNPNDFYSGYLVDCFSDVLSDCNEDPLDTQYPNRALKLEYNIAGYEDSMLWTIAKILIAKVWVPVCFLGSHDLNYHLLPPEKKGFFSGRGEIEVHHYRWRKSLATRLKSKSYNKDGRAEKILNYFKESSNGTI